MNTDEIQRELISGSEHRLRQIEQLVSLADEQQTLILGRRHAEFQESLDRQDALLADMSEAESREQSLMAEFVRADGAPELSTEFRTGYRRMNRRVRDAVMRLESRLARNSAALGTMIERTDASVCTVSGLLGERWRRRPEAASSGV